MNEHMQKGMEAYTRMVEEYKRNGYAVRDVSIGEYPMSAFGRNGNYEGNIILTSTGEVNIVDSFRHPDSE